MSGKKLVLLLAGSLLLTVSALLGLPILALMLIVSEEPRPAMPPLLQGVTAASGWTSGGCPPPSRVAAGLGREALSPVLTQRLASTFPAGSDPRGLRAALLSQGFRLLDPCPEDVAINRASFWQAGGSYRVFATVAWRQTADSRIEWTKGFVSYVGL